jgi:hypothetical protein
MNVCHSFIFILICSTYQAQDDTIRRQQDLPLMRVDKNFDIKYKRTLKQLRRVYPLALTAKAHMIEYNEEVKDIDKKRRIKKFGKNAQQELKDEFLYDIKDLYIDEGILLMKLVHRETGMTVSDIIQAFRGGFKATLYEGMGKIWGQDLGIVYDPDDEDWIVELVLQDILSGKVDFDFKLNKMNKEAFKVSQKEYHENRKRYKRTLRKTRREERREKRMQKK